MVAMSTQIALSPLINNPPQYQLPDIIFADTPNIIPKNNIN